MANVRNDTISIDFDHFVHIELFLPRYKTEYHLVFIPLHRLHLFRSIGLFIGPKGWTGTAENKPAHQESEARCVPLPRNVPTIC